MNNWTLTIADDEELHRVLSSHGQSAGYPWPRASRAKPHAGEVGVLHLSASDRPTPPACLVVSADDSRRLFGRYSQLRSDLSPLSAWTHILDWEQFESLSGDTRVPHFSGLDAAWTGLIIAEALMLAERPVSQLKLAACLSTSTFAVARTCGLWPTESMSTTLDRYDRCQVLIRSSNTAGSRLRRSLEDVWEVLATLTNPLPRHSSPDTGALSECLEALIRARADGGDEWQILRRYIALPQTDRIHMLEAMPAEQRVKEFDRVVNDMGSVNESDRRLKNQLFFLAGYLATVAAGGAPSLSLAERLVDRYPQITAWAYVIGSVGEQVTWTSGFDGLGRLVARELQRPFRIDESPFCDFALSEATVLVDRALQDPLVHLRVKQARLITVALSPGVNIAVPLSDATNETRSRSASVASTPPARSSTDDPLRILAKALTPYLLDELQNTKSSSTNASKRGGRSAKSGDQRLPLERDDEYPRR